MESGFSFDSNFKAIRGFKGYFVGSNSSGTASSLCNFGFIGTSSIGSIGSACLPCDFYPVLKPFVLRTLGGGAHCENASFTRHQHCATIGAYRGGDIVFSFDSNAVRLHIATATTPHLYIVVTREVLPNGNRIGIYAISFTYFGVVTIPNKLSRGIGRSSSKGKRLAFAYLSSRRRKVNRLATRDSYFYILRIRLIITNSRKFYTSIISTCFGDCESRTCISLDWNAIISIIHFTPYITIVTHWLTIRKAYYF